MLKVMSAVIATAVIAASGAAFAAEQNNNKNVQPANAVKQESAQARCEKEFKGDSAKVAECVAKAAAPAASSATKNN